MPLCERSGQEEGPVLPGVGVVASVEKQGRKAAALLLDISDMEFFAIFGEAVKETLNRQAMSWKTDGQDVHHDRQQRIEDQWIAGQNRFVASYPVLQCFPAGPVIPEA